MANVADYSRSYNVYDTIRRSLRTRRYQSKIATQAPKQDLTVEGVPSTGDVIGTVGSVKSQVTGVPSSSYMTDIYTDTASGAQKLSPDEVEAGLTIGADVLTSGEAAISQGTPYGIQTWEDNTLGQIGSALVSALDPSPFGIFSSLMGGQTVTDPYGRQTAVPGGVLGAVAEMNIEKQYEVAEKIKAGTPGYHQFYANNQLVSIVPQSVFGYDVGYTTLGTVSGNPQEVINQYAAMYGVDPATVDLSQRPGEKGFGTPLEGFVRGSGGFNQEGDFVGYNGQTMSEGLSVGSLEAHIGLVNSIQGPAAAINALNTSNVNASVRDSMIEAVRSGELTAKQVIDNNGNVVGFETGLGSVVRSSSGNIVTSGSGKPVTSGAGILSARAVEEAQRQAEAASGDSGYDLGQGTVSGYTTVSGGGDGGDRDSGSSRSSTSQAAASEDAYSSSDTYFAKGGRVGMQEGGVPPEQVPAGEAPVAAEAGFVGTEPENVPEVETVADDVPMEVPEGTFVLNAAAVEFMGSADVKAMILEAMQEAEKQGIDIKQENAKIAKEDLVSLVVSKGEVIIPPQLAEIIGYDRLNKINNRGKAEVEKRSQEAEQQEAPAPKPPILAKSGGFISKPA